MSDFRDAHVVLYHERDRGFEYERESYEVADLGDVPTLGDLIVHPGIPVGADRQRASSHTIYEVKRRYFKPRISENYGPRIILVVAERPGEDAEADLLYR